MSSASIDPKLCDRQPGCPARRVCPQEAIHRPGPGVSWAVDPEKCTGCGVCMRVCPMGAISMTELER